MPIIIFRNCDESENEEGNLHNFIQGIGEVISNPKCWIDFGADGGEEGEESPYDLLSLFTLQRGIRPDETIDSVDIGRIQYNDAEGNRILEFNGGLTVTLQASGVLGDLAGFSPDLVYLRENGLAIIETWTLANSGSNSGEMPSWRNSLTLTGNAVLAYAVWQDGSMDFRIDDTLGLRAIFPHTVSTKYTLALIVNSIGAEVWVKGGVFNHFTRVAWTERGTKTNLRPIFFNTQTSTYFLDNPSVVRFGREISPLLIDQSGSAYFNQSLGSELLTNGDFSAWTADDPNGWTVINESGGDVVTQNPAGQCNIVTASSTVGIRQSVLAVGSIYETSVNLTVVTSGSLSAGDATLAGGAFSAVSAVNVRNGIWKAQNSSYQIIRGQVPSNVSFDDVSTKLITPNAVLTGVADGWFVFDFVLPSSPVAGQRIICGYRVVDSDGVLTDGFWVEIRRNDANSAWDFIHQRSIAGAIAAINTLTGVGSPDQVIVRTLGSNHDIWTKEGSTYTKRGGTAVNTNHQTATGVQVIYSSSFDQSVMRVRAGRLIGAEIDSLLDFDRQGLSYLLQSEFYTPAAPPVASPYTAEPGGQSIVLNQTDGNFTISGGQLIYPAQGTPVWGDQGLYASQSFDRVAGRAFMWWVNTTTFGANGMWVGLKTNNSDLDFDQIVDTLAFQFLGATIALLSSGGSGANLATATAGLGYKVAIVTFATGAAFFVQGGIFVNWTLMFVHDFGTTTPLTMAFSNYNGVGALGFMRVRDVPALTALIKTFEITSFTQSLGSELLTNGNFSAWTADDPNGWTVVGEVGADPEVSEVGAAEGHGGSGTGAANLFSSATANEPRIRQNILTSNGIYKIQYTVSNRVSGILRPEAGNNNGETVSNTGTKFTVIKADASSFYLRSISSSIDLTIDDVSVMLLTPNAIQIASPNSMIDTEYTINSDLAGHRFMLWYRLPIPHINDLFSNGWVAYIRRNDADSAWDFLVDSYALGVATNRVSVTGIGTTDAFRVICDGALHDFYTRSGSTWTKRGSQVNNSSFQTGSGSCAVYTDNFTPTRHVAYPRNNAAYEMLEKNADTSVVISKSTSLQEYLATLGGILNFRFDESSGNLLNYGTESGANGTVSGCTRQQPGQVAEQSSYFFDGLDNNISIANGLVPNVAALTTQRWMFLVNAQSLGESSEGTLSMFGILAPDDHYLAAFVDTNRLNTSIKTDGTDALSRTNTNQVDFLGQWALVFMDYDDTNALGLGRRIRLWRATGASATTLLTLATNTAATGTVDVQTGALNIGNRANLSRGFHGYMDAVFCGAGLWTPAAAPTDLTIMNNIRQIAFQV